MLPSSILDCPSSFVDACSTPPLARPRCPRNTSRERRARRCAPSYRLAPEHPYPAGLDDALAVYRALLSAGHQAQHIAVVGDSAGGGLAMSLVLRLREAGEELPGSLGLISPWLDLTCSAPAITANAASDLMLDPRWLPMAANDYGGPADAADLRPLEADLAGLPPLHVVAASGEVLIDDADCTMRNRISGR